MSEVIISADSTCDLSPQQLEQNRIHTFPFYIEFRGKSYRDNVDITPDVIFEGYYEDKTLPKTGARSKEQYKAYFEELIADGSQVIHFDLGSALSAAYENASEAAEELDGVYVIDGKSLSTGVGLQVLAACKMRDDGMSAEDIAAAAAELHSRSHASFVLDTMEFLAAGGRCPSIVAFVGKMINLRPEIKVDNQSGAMSVGKPYRGKQVRVLEKYVANTLARYSDIDKDQIFITHTGVAPEIVADLRARLESEGFVNIYETVASCTISSHCGPGTLGILFMTETPSA